MKTKHMTIEGTSLGCSKGFKSSLEEINQSVIWDSTNESSSFNLYSCI